jgi:hypothetical protein
MGDVSVTNELSSRPERSEVEGPAVSASRYQMPTWKAFCSSGAKPRELQFRGPFLEMFFKRAKHSRGISIAIELNKKSGGG